MPRNHVHPYIAGGLIPRMPEARPPLDVIPMSTPWCLCQSYHTGCRLETNFKYGYCCQIYVPFSDEDRRTSRDHPQSRPFVYQQLVFEASCRWVLHNEAVMLRRMFKRRSSNDVTGVT